MKRKNLFLALLVKDQSNLWDTISSGRPVVCLSVRKHYVVPLSPLLLYTLETHLGSHVVGPMI